MFILIVCSLTARWSNKDQGDRAFSFYQYKVPGESLVSQGPLFPYMDSQREGYRYDSRMISFYQATSLV